MGFMDSLIGGLKKAADEIDKKAGLSGENSLGNFASMAQEKYNEAVGNGGASSGGDSAPAQSAPAAAPASQLDMVIAPYVRVTDKYYYGDADTYKQQSYEVPNDFLEYDSGAYELEMVYMKDLDDSDYEKIYMDKPYIGIQLSTSEFKEKTPTNVGCMSFKCNDWIKSRGSIVKYYGFNRKDSELLLIMYAKPEVLGTPMADKLSEILDHAAETYTFEE